MVQIVTHGTLDYTELAARGLAPDDLTVFSSNINPFGPPPALLDAVRAAVTGPVLARYPDRLSTELRKILAAYHQVDPDCVVVGNGTADLMWLIGLLYLQDIGREKTVILAPTFGEYANVAALVNTHALHLPLPGWQRDREGRYAPGPQTLDECAAAVARAAPAVVFLCNPNNPTGELLDARATATLMAAAPDALWIVDEAYMEFAAQSWCAVTLAQVARLIVLRSMTKDFSLGGIRLGYLLAPPEMAARIQAAQPPWNVNILAQVAGKAAMENLEWRARAMQDLRTETERLRQAFGDLGLAPRPTTVNYFLTPIDDPGQLRGFLLACNLLIRDCTSFGLPNYFRVATQKPADNDKLVDGLRDFLAEHPAN